MLVERQKHLARDFVQRRGLISRRMTLLSPRTLCSPRMMLQVGRSSRILKSSATCIHKNRCLFGRCDASVSLKYIAFLKGVILVLLTSLSSFGLVFDFDPQDFTPPRPEQHLPGCRRSFTSSAMRRASTTFLQKVMQCVMLN